MKHIVSTTSGNGQVAVSAEGRQAPWSGVRLQARQSQVSGSRLCPPAPFQKGFCPGKEKCMVKKLSIELPEDIHAATVILSQVTRQSPEEMAAEWVTWR